MIITAISLLFTISVYYKQKRCIDEDKKQFASQISNTITRSKVEIENIILNNKEINYEDIKCLTEYHRNIDRGLFGFKKKASFINSELEDGFQELWDNYKYLEPFNEEDISLYYEELSDGTDNGSVAVKLNDDDIHMLQEILKFYNKVRKKINDLI